MTYISVFDFMFKDCDCYISVACAEGDCVGVEVFSCLSLCTFCFVALSVCVCVHVCLCVCVCVLKTIGLQHYDAVFHSMCVHTCASS